MNNYTYTFIQECVQESKNRSFILVKINELDRYFLIEKILPKYQLLELDILDNNSITPDIEDLLKNDFNSKCIHNQLNQNIFPSTSEKDTNSVGNVLLKTALHDRNFNIILNDH